MEDNSVCLPAFRNIEYSSRSYVEMPQSGEVSYISTIVGVRGNPVYKGKGIWVSNTHQANSSTIKVDKDDIRAKRHYVKILIKDGKELKIWECGLCGKEFKFQYTLVRHIPTHTDVRNYQCDICPKAFRQLSTLAQHKATHLNMRPFVCDYCKKTFNRISTLISHKKIHYDEKRHVCPYCGKGFHQKGNLRNHMYTHTNERPYKCDICHKGFNQKSNLVCHKISTHARKMLHQCDICNLNFAKPNLYSSHMESVHHIAVKVPEESESNQLLRNNIETEAECALVDESNNIIYRLPISQGNKLPGSENNSGSFGTIKQGNSPKENHGNEILTIVKHIPSEAMNQLGELGHVPFVLLYQPGDSQPKICKAITQTDQYALVHPCSNDISKCFIPNSNSLSHKFPIVSTVIQKKDSTGRVQTLVLPAGGLHPKIVDSYEGANGQNVFSYYKAYKGKVNENSSDSNSGSLLSDQEDSEDAATDHPETRNRNNKTAVIYTKTQPNVRNSKHFVLPEAQSESNKEYYPPLSNIPSDQDPLTKTSLNTEDLITTVEKNYKIPADSRFTYVFLPDNPINTNLENIVVKDANDNYSIDTQWTIANFNNNKDGNSNLYAPEETLANDVSSHNLDVMKENNFQSNFDSFGLLDFENEFNQCCKEETNLENISVNNILKGNIKNEIVESQNMTIDNSCCDIEPTLFNNLEPLRDSISKYIIDFDGDTFDLFDDCGFSGSLMSNMNNNIAEDDT